MRLVCCVGLIVAAIAASISIVLAQSGGDAEKSADSRRAVRSAEPLSNDPGQMSEELARAFFLRGIAYQKKGESDRALENYDQAIGLKPNFQQAFHLRGLVHSHKGNLARAIQDYDEAIRLKPDDYEALANRGRANYARGDVSHAIDDWSEAIRLKADFVDALGNRGHAYWSKGEFDRALHDYEEAIRLKPGLPELLYGRGNVYRMKGESDRAIQDYDRVVQLDPNHYRAFYWRGFIHSVRREYRTSIVDFANGVRVSCNDPWVVLWLYLARSRAGEDGRQELAISTANRDSRIWPGPLVELYLGARSVESVFKAVSNTRELCHAYFYVGQYEVIANRMDNATRMFEKAAGTCVRNSAEQASARTELARPNGP